ncbi:hypothetical protein GCM10010405_09120 [Streptomyces macrosporus]|uniref:Uncharacterized protein n=1 Tax=Streptomyces macrosporus TaxID=44032 RepID=A0ABP5WML2_9ACTN
MAEASPLDHDPPIMWPAGPSVFVPAGPSGRRRWSGAHNGTRAAGTGHDEAMRISSTSRPVGRAAMDDAHFQAADRGLP